MLRSTFRSAVVTALSAVLMLTWSAVPAHAGFPGKNGRIVVDANLGKGYELYVIAGDGSTYKRITNFQDGDFGRTPTWAPDGSKIVFNTVAADTGDAEIFTVEPNGAGLTQLTHDAGANDLVPRYSYDGTKIVFMRTIGDTLGWVMTMNADGTGMQQVTAGGFCPTFAPDGRIYYDDFINGLISAIWVMNADGSGKHRLTKAKLRAGCPEVSPDGTKVAFYDNQNTPPAPSSIWVMNSDGSGLTRLTHQKFHQDVYPRFSPDGKKIVFATDRYYFNNCCFDLFEMNVDGSNVVPITSNLTVDGCPQIGNCVPPDWGPKP